MPARVERTPWLDHLDGSGEELAFSLRFGGGEASIEATTFAASIRPPRPTAEGTTFPVLHSAIARFRWDGEEAFGMLERSARIPPRFASD